MKNIILLKEYPPQIQASAFCFFVFALSLLWGFLQQAQSKIDIFYWTGILFLLISILLHLVGTIYRTRKPTHLHVLGSLSIVFVLYTIKSQNPITKDWWYILLTVASSITYSLFYWFNTEIEPHIKYRKELSS